MLIIKIATRIAARLAVKLSKPFGARASQTSPEKSPSDRTRRAFAMTLPAA
ncbi:hypothetical protein LCGC14_2199060, partial [marine sediment metagenome]